MPARAPHLTVLTVAVLCLALVVPLVPQQDVWAQTTYIVTSGENSGNGSLRDVIAAADPGDTITFADSLATISLTDQITINKNLTIQGPGQDVLTISGGGVTRVLEIIKSGNNVEVEISGLTISGGGNTDWGAGIFINGATVAISNSTISGNHASGEYVIGGGIFNNGGNLTITRSTIANNTSTSTEGYAQAGGIRNNNGTLTIHESTISGNTVRNEGSGDAYGGGIYHSGKLSIRYSTISGNTVVNMNADSSHGGGIFDHNTTGMITVITDSTIANNTAISGSNIETISGSTNLVRTIIAGNGGENCTIGAGPDGSINSLDYNLASDNSCNLSRDNDLPNHDPQLGDLADNGGPTWTHAITTSSPAYNAGGSNSCFGSFDQRGVERPQLGTCDIGAFELTRPPILNLPDPMNVEATSSAGALVPFSVSAVDFNGDELTVTCDYQSGTVFAIGATPVPCSATDRLGETTESTFTITVADTTAPVVNMQEDMTVEATGPDGTEVEFVVTATDAVDTSPVVTCIPPSGTAFQIGTIEVSCTATDTANNTSEPVTFDVTVEDTTPPLIIEEPGDMTVVATGPEGAEVSFHVTVTDLVDPDPDILCTPPSGSVFQIGTHQVSCTATDDAGNPSEPAIFTVTVLGGDSLLATLIQDTRGSAIPAYLKPRLLAYLDVADRALERGQTSVACHTLAQFSGQIDTLSPRYINSALADQLSDDAQTIREILGC